MSMALPGSANRFSDSNATRRYDAIAVASCITILVVALGLGYLHEVGNFGVETDFYGSYAVEADNILEGRSYSYQHNPPGYPLLLAAFSLLIGDPFVAGKILSSFATALFGWITYLLSKALFDPKVALVSTTLSLLALVPYSFLAAMDIVGATLMLLPLWIVLHRPAVSYKIHFVAGLFAGIAYLVRYQAVFVTVGIVFSLLLAYPDGEVLRTRLSKAGLFLGGTFLMTCPWLVVNWQTSGHPLASTAPSQIAAHFYYGGDQYGTTLRQAGMEFDSISDVVLYDPLRFLGEYFKDTVTNIMRFGAQGKRSALYLTAGAGFLLCAGGGLILLLPNLSRRRLTFLIVSIVGYLLLGLVGFYLRYYFFLLPLLFLLAAYFLFCEDVFIVLENTPVSRIASSWLVVIIMAAFLSISSYSITMRTLSSEPRYLLEIADFLEDRSSPDDLIIVRKPHLAYLAGLERVFPLAETADGYLAEAREIGARYVVYSDYEASLWPGLKSLANPDILPQGYRLIYRHAPTGTLVYEVYN